ncbi:hypothetical protein Tco_1571031 [Tanacetum coccineum]
MKVPGKSKNRAHEKENDKKMLKKKCQSIKYRQIFHMAQHVIPAAQLVPQYKPIERCNNYVVLQSIPCSPKCKIVGLILLDHLETHENPFVAPANIHTIEAFMNRVGYQGVVDKILDVVVEGKRRIHEDLKLKRRKNG